MNEIILILIMQLIFVPLFTLRTLFLVKNMIPIAAGLGFLEALVQVFGLGLVFSGDQSGIAMLVYALGFGIGLLIGGYIENKLAVGYNSLIVNLDHKNEKLINRLREEGFGVTSYHGEGRDSERYRLDILTKRSRENELIHLIEEDEPKAFIISYEARRFKGGFLVSSMKKRER
ncbi:MAG TPA: hypothetical protein DHN33_06065 [Eubacteriaceae bacterium]|nr:hypothetical protein [Eubacteriaceae bacterium]